MIKRCFKLKVEQTHFMVTGERPWYKHIHILTFRLTPLARLWEAWLHFFDDLLIASWEAAVRSSEAVPSSGWTSSSPQPQSPHWASALTLTNSVLSTENVPVCVRGDKTGCSILDAVYNVDGPHAFYPSKTWSQPKAHQQRISLGCLSSSLGKDANWQITNHLYWIALVKISLSTDCREQ